MCLDYFSGINPGICKTKKMSVFKAEYQSPSTSMFPKDLIQHRHISVHLVVHWLLYLCMCVRARVCVCVYAFCVYSFRHIPPNSLGSLS